MRPREVCRAEKLAQRAARDAAIDAQDRAAAERLAKVSLGRQTFPLFTEACPDGSCARCHGVQFRQAHRTDAGTAIAVFGPAAGLLTLLTRGELAQCVTCGTQYEAG